MTLYEFLKQWHVEPDSLIGLKLVVNDLRHGDCIFKSPIENVAPNEINWVPVRFMSLLKLYHGDAGKLLDMKVENFLFQQVMGKRYDNVTFLPDVNGDTLALVAVVQVSELKD